MKHLKKKISGSPNQATNYLAMGIGLGLCFGAALGAAMKNVGLWVPIGMCFGVAMGAALDAQAKRKLNIRSEMPNDYATVSELTKTAFAGMEHAAGDEQDLVERLRKSAAYIPELSLIAEINGKIVGHIMFTKITIGGTDALCLAPVSVLPEHQKQGVGSALIGRGHAAAAELGYGVVLLVGHKDYYPRFGYEPASKYGITQPFPAPDECVMVKFLTEKDKSITGEAIFPQEFH